MTRRTATPESIAKTMNTLKELWKPGAPAGREGMTLAELGVQRDALSQALARLNAIKPCCHSCREFDMGVCRMHGDIPAEFQKVEGECTDWRYDGVPF